MHKCNKYANTDTALIAKKESASDTRRLFFYEIAQAVLPIIAEMPDAKVESCEVTENRMCLKVVNPRLEMDVVPGDTVQRRNRKMLSCVCRAQLWDSFDIFLEIGKILVEAGS